MTVTYQVLLLAFSCFWGLFVCQVLLNGCYLLFLSGISLYVLLMIALEWHRREINGSYKRL
jgi:hypothetical protein